MEKEYKKNKKWEWQKFKVKWRSKNGEKIVSLKKEKRLKDGDEERKMKWKRENRCVEKSERKDKSKRNICWKRKP